MSVVEYILDGLEAALELERELGVRSVECDRGLRGGASPKAVKSGEAVSRPLQGSREIPSIRSGQETAFPLAGASRVVPSVAVNRTIEQSSNQTITDLVFLHDRPLTQAGVEMMAKILNALGKPDAPIVVAPPVPQAKVTVVLGGLALKKYFPGMKGEPGQWQKTPDGCDVLITYSPAYILRFGTVTPAVQKIKQDMWLSLKAVRQRLSTS